MGGCVISVLYLFPLCDLSISSLPFPSFSITLPLFHFFFLLSISLCFTPFPSFSFHFPLIHFFFFLSISLCFTPFPSFSFHSFLFLSLHFPLLHSVSFFFTSFSPLFLPFPSHSIPLLSFFLFIIFINHFLLIIFRVGFRYRFALINDDGESALQVEEYFLQRLRVWRNKKGKKNKFSQLKIFVAFFFQLQKTSIVSIN